MPKANLRIGLVSCAALPEPDPDRALLADALAAAGLSPAWIAWDDPAAEPGDFSLCVLRSTWNYYREVNRFVAWLDRARSVTQLLNPYAVLRWNLHKGYLQALANQGIASIPTLWVERGARCELPARLAERDWSDVVIKPAISAGSNNTRRFGASQFEAAHAFCSELAAGGDVMIQPYLPTIEADGERALVWIDGAFTHAVTKSPRFSGGDESVSPADTITPAERAFGERVLAAAPHANELLYARVDVITDNAGEMCLSELELLEPSLFLLQHPPALDRLVAGIVRRVQT